MASCYPFLSVVGMFALAFIGVKIPMMVLDAMHKREVEKLVQASRLSDIEYKLNHLVVRHESLRDIVLKKKGKA